MIKTAVKKAAPKLQVKKAISKVVKQPATNSDQPLINIIKTTKCLTVSGKSTLTYNIGMDEKSAIQLRVNENTGGGYFSKEWVAFDSIVSALEAVPKDKPITSIHLFPLFKGKSVNTPGYLLAVLLNEKLLTSFKGMKRQYQLSNTGVEHFRAKVDKHKQDMQSN